MAYNLPVPFCFLMLLVYVSVSRFYWLLFPFCIAKLPNSFSCVLSAAFSSRSCKYWIQYEIFQQYKLPFAAINWSMKMCLNFEILQRYCAIISLNIVLYYVLRGETTRFPHCTGPVNCKWSISSGRMYHHYL